METDVGIALVSMMITVITFLAGFFLVFGGRLLGDVSGMLGYLRGLTDRIRRSGSGKEFLEKLEKDVEDGARDRRRMEIGISGVFVLSMASVITLLTVLQQVGVEGWEDWIPFSWALVGLNIVVMVGLLSTLMVVSGRFVEFSRQREASHR